MGDLKESIQVELNGLIGHIYYEFTKVSSCKDAETQVVALILFIGRYRTGEIDALAKEH